MTLKNTEIAKRRSPSVERRRGRPITPQPRSTTRTADTIARVDAYLLAVGVLAVDGRRHLADRFMAGGSAGAVAAVIDATKPRSIVSAPRWCARCTMVEQDVRIVPRWLRWSSLRRFSMWRRTVLSSAGRR